MITDRAAYERWCEAERWERLQRMSIDDSIALGEALLTSELMEHVTATVDAPLSLAIALGLAARRPPQARGSTS
jgi:hypothetical protein